MTPCFINSPKGFEAPKSDKAYSNISASKKRIRQ